MRIQKDTKKDQLIQKEQICKGALLSRMKGTWKDGRRMFLGLFWGLGLSHWACSPGGGEPAGSYPWKTSLAEWKRPIRQVAIKHFIFVNFFKFMISKKNKD